MHLNIQKTLQNNIESKYLLTYRICHKQINYMGERFWMLFSYLFGKMNEINILNRVP